MNPDACTIVLRPRTPLEVFDLTLLYLREQWTPMLRLFGWIVVPAWLFVSVLTWFVDGSPWVLLILPLLLPWLRTPFTVAGGHLLFAHRLGMWQILKRAWGLELIKATLVTRLLGGLLAVVSIGQGLWAWLPATLFVEESVLLERVPLDRALQRGRRLATGHIGASLVGVLAQLWLTVWCAVVAEAGCQLIVAQGLQLGQPFGSLWDGQVTPYLWLGLLAAQPLFALYRLLLYIDVRTRVEGWDLQVAFRAAARRREGR